MIVKGIALLASNTSRTKAYIQTMVKENYYPEICIVYSDDINKMKDDAINYCPNSISEYKFFDDACPLIWMLDHYNINYVTIENKDINSDEMFQYIKGLKSEYIIYSGYGGYILKKHLFTIKKKYIHVHAGLLPKYRGSTTIYYSYLQEKIFGAAAIFLSEGIDEGEVIYQETFLPPAEKVDIDYIYEPYIRSRVLIHVMKNFCESGFPESRKQSKNEAETFFIIHPVLKHLVLLDLEK